MTKKIYIRPIVKVIGKKEYYVDSFFEEDADMNVTDKIKKLLNLEIKSQTEPLLPCDSKVTLHNPMGGAIENHGGKAE